MRKDSSVCIFPTLNSTIKTNSVKLTKICAEIFRSSANVIRRQPNYGTLKTDTTMYQFVCITNSLFINTAIERRLTHVLVSLVLMYVIYRLNCRLQYETAITYDHIGF